MTTTTTTTDALDAIDALNTLGADTTLPALVQTHIGFIRTAYDALRTARDQRRDDLIGDLAFHGQCLADLGYSKAI